MVEDPIIKVRREKGVTPEKPRHLHGDGKGFSTGTSDICRGKEVTPVVGTGTNSLYQYLGRVELKHDGWTVSPSCVLSQRTLKVQRRVIHPEDS